MKFGNNYSSLLGDADLSVGREEREITGGLKKKLLFTIIAIRPRKRLLFVYVVHRVASNFKVNNLYLGFQSLQTMIV